MITGYHTRWVRPPEQAGDQERVAIRDALAFGKAVYDQRRALDLSVADLAATLDADVRLTAGLIFPAGQFRMLGTTFRGQPTGMFGGMSRGRHGCERCR